MNSGSKKINTVIFTIYFPPVISIASYRLEAFAKYLDKEKFNITVICPKTESDHKVRDVNSINVIRLTYKPHPLKIKFSKKDTFIVHKIKALYNRIFSIFIHDEYTDWVKEAIKAFKKIDAIHKTDIVLSSFPTVAPHAVALKLKMKGADFKWIADMRDEMSRNPFNNYFERKYLQKIEQKLFSEASCITTTTPSFVNEFRNLAGDNICIEEIRNGFDFEVSDDYNYNEIFTITHTGSFYADIKPYKFLLAVSSLISENELPELRILFIGAGKAVSVPNDLKGVVSITEKIPHSMAIKGIKESDANLLVTPHSMSKAIQGKLYEYIASQKPVIALTEKNSEAAKLINRCNAGFIADLNNINEIKQIIRKAYELWETRQRLKTDIEYFKQFHRKNQVKKLEKLILEKI